MPKERSCDLFPRTFASGPALFYHKQTHSGVQYNCPQCNKSFTKDSSLKTHSLIHAGEKPHKCPECDKSFSQKDGLRRHSFIHSGEKIHTSNQCNFSVFMQRCRQPQKAHHKTHRGKNTPLQSMWIQNSNIKRPANSQEDALW